MCIRVPFCDELLGPSFRNALPPISRDWYDQSGRITQKEPPLPKDALREFLEFIESSQPESVEKLMHRVLLKSRELTGAEAGTIFILRGRGRHSRLEAADSQNDVIAVKPASFVLPITTSSIAGYTAATAETVFVDDLYDLSTSVPYTFDRRFDKRHGYHSRSMLSGWSSSSTGEPPDPMLPRHSVTSRPDSSCRSTISSAVQSSAPT